MKEIITNTISSNELARIGKMMHSILMQNIRFTLGKMNLPQGKYLAGDAKTYDLPREVAEVLARDAKFDWTQREEVSDHFNVLELEKAVSKVAVQKKVKEQAVVKKHVSFDFDVEKSITSIELVEIINNVRAEDGRPGITHNDFLKKADKVLQGGCRKIF